MSLTITDITTEFGAYYIDNGQNMQSLVKQLHRQSKTASLFRRQTTVNTQERMGQFLMNSVLQPFQKAFTPSSALTFKPLVLDLFKMKVDASEYPDEIEKSWLGFLDNVDDNDRTKWPFVRWFIEQYLLPKKEEDFEMSAVYSGVYAAPTPGTAGTADESMDGIRKQINDLIDAGSITPIETGAPDSDPEAWNDQVEEFVAGIDKRYWRQPMKLAMSEELELRFRVGKKAKYNINYAQEPNLDSVANFPNITIVGLPSMDDSTKIWCSPAANMVNLVKKASQKQTIQVEGEDRKVKFWGDWWETVGFWIPQIVFTNDEDLTGES